MRALSLLVLVSAMAIAGFLYLGNVTEHVPEHRDDRGTADRIGTQVESTLQQYQQRLDEQAREN